MNWVHPFSILVSAALLAFAETAFPGLRRVLDVQPDLLPSLVVYAALQGNLPLTAATAVVGGLSFDALSAGPLGLTVLPLLGVGTILHLRREVLLRESAWAQALLGGASALVVPLASLALLFVLWPLLANPAAPPPQFPEWRSGPASPPSVGPGLVWQLAVLTGVGLAATPVVFRVFRWIEGTFHYRRVSRQAYRTDREIRRGRH